MNAIFVLVLVACLPSDLCNAKPPKKGKKKSGIEKKDVGDDYQLGGLLADPDLINSTQVKSRLVKEEQEEQEEVWQTEEREGW